MAADVTIGRVVLVRPRSLFKSSSGKICRKTNKLRLLDGTFEETAAAADLTPQDLEVSVAQVVEE